MHSLRHRFSTSRSIQFQTCCNSPSVFVRVLSATTEAPVHALRGPAVSVAAPQPLASVLTADGSGEDPGRLGPRGPKLLPRPVRPKVNGKSKNSGGGGGGGGGRGPAGTGERTLASLAAYSGLVGTTALLLGNLAGFDLWGEFDWMSLDDLRMAAVASVPLQLLNAALLLPSFSSPQRLPDMGNLEAMEAKLRAEHERLAEPPTEARAAAATSPAAAQVSAPSAAGASAAAENADTGTSISTAASTAASALASSTPPAADAAGSEASSPSLQLGGPSSAPSPSSPAAAVGSSVQPAGPPGLVPADTWGRPSGGSEGKSGGEDAWTALRSALHLTQGYYISNNPTARLTPAAEVAYSFIDGAAVEMLYRGVALTWLASWLEDRVYEAGVDEAVSYQLPAAAAAVGLPQLGDAFATLGVYGACECAVAAATASFVVLSVLSRSRRAAQRLELLLSAASSASASGVRAGGGRRRGAASGSGTSGGAASGSGTSGAAASGAAGSGSESASGVDARATAQVLFGAGGPSVGASNAGVVMQRAAAIQATRDAIQILLINAVFIASGGNLAASYTVSVVNQLVISAMQRRGARRIRERSAALARELRAYNAEMQRIANKYKDKLPKAAAVRLEGLGKDDSFGADTSQSTEAASKASASSGLGSGSDPAPASPSGFTDASDSGRGTATGSGSSSSSSGSNVGSGLYSNSNGGDASRGKEEGVAEVIASVSSAVAAVSHSGRDGNGSGGGVDSSSSLGRALAMLDRLVPEPAKPPANDRTRRQQSQQPPQQQPLQ